MVTMATHPATPSNNALTNIPLSGYHSNHIDLTGEDDDPSSDSYPAPNFTQRPRTDASYSSPRLQQSGIIQSASPNLPPPALLPRPDTFEAQQTSHLQRYPSPLPSPFSNPNLLTTPYSSHPRIYRPPFVGHLPRQVHTPQPSSVTPTPISSSPLASANMDGLLSRGADKQVIDLTSSPSPPPSNYALQPISRPLPPDLPPKTPVCIGQLTVTALVLYPVPYLLPKDPTSNVAEWAPVRLQYEHTPNRPSGAETIHIKVPQIRLSNGDIIPEEVFGVVEQKVANALGPMLGKGLIRLDTKVRKGPPTLPILPLQMLVYTPKGNIPVVGNYLQQCALLLDHPSPPYDGPNFAKYHYHNPHDPPPGGHRALPANRFVAAPRWNAPAQSIKSIEVQRSQVDELFKNLKDGDDLTETEPAFEVATKLYPHQKKALTFLLEREREKSGMDGTFSSLWQPRHNHYANQKSWLHLVTQKEVHVEPQEAKGAILADDMGLGKTITCVSLIAATLTSAQAFAEKPVDPVVPPAQRCDSPAASQFANSVWGMPDVSQIGPSSAKAKAKAARAQEQMEAEFVRASRIKTRSRATLIICPLSTVANWEDQFKEHWRGEVSVFGGSGGCSQPVAQASQGLSQMSISQTPGQTPATDAKEACPSKGRVREGTPLRVYVYHGNARRPDPAFLADFDAVITTYSTLASEFSRQNRSRNIPDADDEEEDGNSSEGIAGEVDENTSSTNKSQKAKKNGLKRKKGGTAQAANITEVPSALQSIYWFRVVLDEAHSIKETGTVGSRASCDLMADRRLCLTGTPVQNKLDDVFALIKFLRLEPFDDKNIWTEFIGTPVKFGQTLGIARLQMIMKCITLRRTKETRTTDGKFILSLPPRRDELRYLKFAERERTIYDQFFNESKAEFNELTNKNEVMKNYVGILQKILRLRQICDHFELVEGKGLFKEGQDGSAIDASVYDNLVLDINRDGINATRAAAIFAILRESATTQCVECGGELCNTADALQETIDQDGPSAPKRARKSKGHTSRAPTRANSPTATRPVLTRCQHLFCLDCYRNCTCPGWPNSPPNETWPCSTCSTPLAISDVVEIKPEAVPESTTKRKSQKREKKSKEAIMENYHPSTKIGALLDDLMQFSRANPNSANYDPHSIEVQMVDHQGNQLDDGIIKTVVFSQWTSMLDKIEDALDVSGIRFDRLDGTMRRDERSRAIDALKHDPGCEVLLVSLKAGGVGLNLTAAQRVYLMDPYWNPAVENQAVDRIHRLGQTRPVTTTRFIIENTIEARLLEVQRKKTELANMTLGQNFSKSELMQRRMEELNQLFETS